MSESWAIKLGLPRKRLQRVSGLLLQSSLRLRLLRSPSLPGVAIPGASRSSSCFLDRSVRSPSVPGFDARDAIGKCRGGAVLGQRAGRRWDVPSRGVSRSPRYIVSVEQGQERPTWRAWLTAALTGVWRAVASADSGQPPAGEGPEPNKRWRAVARSGPRVVRVGDWRYERGVADGDAAEMRARLAANAADDE